MSKFAIFECLSRTGLKPFLETVHALLKLTCPFLCFRTKRSPETLLKGDFDGQKSFRTESVYQYSMNLPQKYLILEKKIKIRGQQPLYKSAQLFDYSIRTTDLSTRFFTLELVDIFETEHGGVIASTKADLLTCATGPQQHCLVMHDHVCLTCSISALDHLLWYL